VYVVNSSVACIVVTSCFSTGAPRGRTRYIDTLISAA